MAIQTQIHEVWSDLDHRLIKDGDNALKKNVNVESVLSSIDNILRTYKGERVMLPGFASNLKSIVFESMDDTVLDFLSKDIKEMIEKWDDRVLVTRTAFLADPDMQSISLSVEFAIKGHGKIFKHEIPIQGEIE